MFIGAHVSVAKGFPSAVSYAKSVGCESMQVFAKSPRRWEGPPTDSDAGRRFAEERETAGIRSAFTHTAYLINLASAEDALWKRSIAALADEITRGRLLGVNGVATHLGTHPSGESEASADRIAEGVQRAFEQAGGGETSDTRLLLENTAGGGRTYGRTIAAIGAILERCAALRPLLGICLDTCHAHAAGIDLGHDVAWGILLSEVERACGPQAIRLIHANDCMFERGFHRDRHAWIGDGTMGSVAFEAMLHRPELRGVSVVIEMPGEVPVKDAENIRRLKVLRGDVL
ncbi:MAG: deoxyribonuclease IV [Coriobacteriia bacterium]|nr:deoxyribonuclease IV [Coriobacteriia bacterium]